MQQHTKQSVAEYLTEKIAQSSKTQLEISREAGFGRPNIITMFKKGKTRVPLNRVGSLARALDTNPRDLLRLVLAEYMPETWQSVEEALGQFLLNPEEEEVIKTYRDMQIDR